MENLILVDENDNEIGAMEKLEGHRKGLLHRAFSIFVFNSKGQLLIQRRARAKYHSAGLWANTCCGHPRLGEDTVPAGCRRLREEMGITTDLEYLYKFFYRVELDNGFMENECDYVLLGKHDEEPSINQD